MLRGVHCCRPIRSTWCRVGSRLGTALGRRSFSARVLLSLTIDAASNWFLPFASDAALRANSAEGFLSVIRSAPAAERMRFRRCVVVRPGEGRDARPCRRADDDGPDPGEDERPDLTRPADLGEPLDGVVAGDARWRGIERADGEPDGDGLDRRERDLARDEGRTAREECRDKRGDEARFAVMDIHTDGDGDEERERVDGEREQHVDHEAEAEDAQYGGYEHERLLERNAPPPPPRRW